jgi:small ligand-binding sensory domain FIST
MAQRSAIGAVLKAVFAALNVSTLTGCISGSTVVVTNDVSQVTAAPYVVVQPVLETRDDTFQLAGKSVLVAVHLYSDFAGDDEILLMNNAAVQLLHYATLSVDNHTLVAVQYEDGSAIAIDDIAGQKRRHWMSTFRVDLRQAS